jgi:uncharacterized membrane protein YcfT
MRPDTLRFTAAPGGVDEGRVPWVDTAKGACIVLVVMMHATLGVGEAMGGEGFMHWVVAFARPFRMPDFFLVSGLFLSRVIDRDWRSYGDKRVVHFLYFYLLWLVIQSGFKFGQVSGGSAAGFIHHLAAGLVEPYSTLWFIYLLAAFSIATKLLRRVPPALLLGVAAALQVASIETHWTLIDEFCARWAYFLAGYLFAPAIFRLATWAVARTGAALAGLGVWAVVNGYFALTPSGVDGFPMLANLPGVALALGGVGAVAIVTMAALLSETRLAAPFRYSGRNSIAIYLAFFLPMALTRTVLIKTAVIQDVGVVSLIVTIAAVLVPLALERIVRHTPMSFLFRRPAAFHLTPSRRGPVLQPAE